MGWEEVGSRLERGREWVGLERVGVGKEVGSGLERGREWVGRRYGKRSGVGWWVGWEEVGSGKR